ncbi:hypothetical protein [Aliarcobacter butzleri]|uniref:Uncharacterized protein n=1 Tax=Aliarcobacter butzleri L351 TaxID=1447259 RepID=A0A837J751_9BACT|nr:hypothetical protein [Aliarcobacter butzleri]KLE01930.1 hypothetical protein AF76_03740 [Aliarcobacter butzleri L351]KLE12370.1 hypothetical protein AF75_09120 [Aliarcobacter butzleri L350]MDN5105766.1 hypothetical protein [Aliarcobacter butzleri]
MNVLKELENCINEFNKNNQIEFSIDTIRIDFKKQYKLSKLKELGVWKKIDKKDKRIMDKLKRRLVDDEVTSAYQLENYNIYFYNSNKDKPKYRIATMVIFGLKQYHKEPTPQQIVSNIISILKNISNIDLCFDMKIKPNLTKLNNYFNLQRYKLEDTYYINETNILMLDKITIYNKAIKNKLEDILWRIEALISIPNIKYLALPLYEFKEIINISKGTLDNDIK